MNAIMGHLSRLAYKITGWQIIDSKGNISVIKKGNMLVLKEGFKTYSAIRADTLYTRLYYDYFIPLAYLYVKPKILVVGIGGGTTPLQLNRLFEKEVELYGVDTNVEMVDLAKKHFMHNVDIQIHIEDGAKYVSGEKNRFDLIFLDAYEDARIPKQFLCEEFINDASKALRGDGILAINVVLGLFDLISYVKKLNKYFKVYHLKPNINSDNVLLVCSKRLNGHEIYEKIEEKMPKNDENEFLFDKYASIEKYL